jgi:transposase
MPDTTRLKTIDTRWTEIETLIYTRATNARAEAANLTIKNIKRSIARWRRGSHGTQSAS